MRNLAVRRSTSMTTLMVQLVDLLAALGSGWLAYQLRFMPPDGEFVTPSSGEQALIIVTSLVGTMMSAAIYRYWQGGSLAAMVGRVTLGWAMTWVLLIVTLALTKSAEAFSRIWLVTWLVMGIVGLWVSRMVSFFMLAQLRRSGYQHKSVLLYGSGQMVQALKERIEAATWSGYDIAGIFAPEDYPDLAALDAQHRPDEIWICLTSTDSARLDELLSSLAESVANIRLVPDLMMYQILNHGLTVNIGIPMVDLSVSPMYGLRTWIKGAEDFVVALLILILLSPLMIAIAIAVKLTSKGPVLFKQRRHGWNGKEIWVYKFRSMEVHQEQPDRVTQATKDDPRVTPLGRFLRKTSLDELPQFINVLQGRMSVVGPRPHAIQHNVQYVKSIPKYALRHKVKPGITGWAQVCGYRGETDTIDKMEARIKHDIYYLEHWSLWMDIKIILLTPIATIQNKNAY